MSVYSRIPIPSFFTTPFNPLSQKELIVEQMAPLSRFKLSGPEMLEADPEVLALFEKIDRNSSFGVSVDTTRKLPDNLRCLLMEILLRYMIYS